MFGLKKRIAAQVTDKLLNVEKPRYSESTKIFPLIPEYGSRPADDHNTSGWWFKWMFIRIWSRDAFDFELSVVIDSHWGIGLIGLIPYVRWAVCIPCPPKLGSWVQKNLWRKSLSQIKNENG